MKTCNEWIKKYRSGVNPITGETNNFWDLSDQMVWDAAQEEIKKSLSSHAVLGEVMAKIRERSLFNDSSIIEIDDAVLEEILSYYFILPKRHLRRCRINRRKL